MATLTFPTATAAQACLQGDGSACARSAGWVGTRTALLAAGMYVATGSTQHLLRDALAGSLGVQAFVMAWAAFGQGREIPSATAALNGHPVGLLTTYAARAALVAAGMYLAGSRAGTLKRALAGTAVIEASVLLWAARRNS